MPDMYVICRACGYEMVAVSMGEVTFWSGLGYVIEVFRWDHDERDYTFHHLICPKEV